jgi:predicted SAM-dependent methyltransferase
MVQQPLPESVEKRINNGEPLSLELGCGDRKRHADAIGIDRLDYAGVDIVGDLYEVLQSFPDRCVSSVYSYHCFEHLTNLPDMVDQLCRIMNPKARLIVSVPHFSNPYYYSDATHRQPFGLYTFSYLAHDRIFSRKCPNYQKELGFNLKKVDLCFKSPRPFYGRWAFKKVVQFIVNLNTYSKEFYEENLCWVFPCYEIQYELERI